MSERRVINVGNFDIEVEKLAEGLDTCVECFYGKNKDPNVLNKDHKCGKIRDPRFPGDDSRTFQQFCFSPEVGLKEIPCAGTLDGIPKIQTKENTEFDVDSLVHSISKYCKYYCLLVCTKDCPLNKFKDSGSEK